MTAAMEVIPAVDIRGGMAVRLYKGDFSREEQYGTPLELALSLVERGAKALHVVDLDAARTGDPVNRAAVLEIVSKVRVPVQVGGGIRLYSDVSELVDAGVRRVIVGTAALEDPERVVDYVRRFRGLIALGLDYRRSDDGSVVLSGRGWTVDSSIDLREVLAEFADEPVASFVLTAIDRDGTLGGPDLETFSELLDLSAVALVAAGGIASLEDIASLARLRSERTARRLAGVVTGKAVVAGKLDIRKACEVCEALG